MKHNLKKLFILTIIITLSGCFGFNGNDDDGTDINLVIPQSEYSPIFMPRDEFENTTELLPAQNIVNSGKIYVKDNFLFVNEKLEGYHIIDNTNPENPQNIAFLKVIGASDLSIKNNSLYVDNASDLIALKLNDNFNAIEITKRIINIFPNPLAISPDGFQAEPTDNQVVVGWELID